MEDHPSIDRTPQPSRGVEGGLTEAQLAALRSGGAVDVAEDALSRLKVFDDPDNQLGIGDVYRAEVSCLECAALGTYNSAEMKIPKFGLAELQSFSCPECGYAYSRTRMVATDRRADLEPLSEGYGRRIVLSVKSERDLAREVILSDGAYFAGGELEMSVRDGVMTTVEGLFRQSASKLAFLQVLNDTSDGETAIQIGDHVTKMVDGLFEGMRNGVPFTVTIDDDSDSSYIQAFEDDVEGQISYSVYHTEGAAVPAATDGQAPPVLCDFAGPVPGAVVQAQYNDEWLDGCTVISLIGVMVKVQQSEDEGSWLVSPDQIRGCDDPSCGCQDFVALAEEHAARSAAVGGSNDTANSNGMSDQEVTDYLNRFAEHVSAQENQADRAAQNRQTSREEELRSELAQLDDLD